MHADHGVGRLEQVGRFDFCKRGVCRVMMKHDQQKRAEYYLYAWQIAEVRRISRETRRPPSEVLRDLLSQALRPGDDQVNTPS